MCQRSFTYFVKRFWPTIEPATPLAWGWYLDAICKHLEKLDDIRRLLVNIAPRHGKTIMLAMFVAWKWLSKPHTRFLVCSYALKRSKEILHKARLIIQSITYREMFPHVQIREDRNTQDKFENTSSGYAAACSVESGVTGDGGSVILFDDPNDIGEINSETTREKTIAFYRTVLTTRLNDPAKDSIVIIQQRAHVNDLSGFLLENQPDLWCKLILPFEYDPARKCATKWFKDPRKNPGDLLSTRKPREEIDALKRDSVGQRVWETQFQQNPKPADGAIFKSEWYRYWDETQENYKLGNRVFAKKDCWRFIAVDLAISQKSQADYTVFAVCDVTPEADLIVLHVERKQLSASKMLATFEALNHTYRPYYFLIEKVAFQDFLIQYTRHLGFTVKEIHAMADKVARSAALEVKLSSGCVWFPQRREGREWIAVTEAELLEFPHGQHDDITDALVYSALEVGRRVKPVKQLPPPVEKSWEVIYQEAMWQGVT